MIKQPKSVAFSKLSKFRSEERAKALRADPAMINLLTPTEIALLFPNYFKKGTPDIGGFAAAISYETGRRQQAFAEAVGEKVGVDPSTGRTKGGWLDRMGQQYGSTAASGNLKQNQQEAYKAARAQGLSDSSARILVANMSGESLKNPGDHHWDRSHMSQGIVQWDPSRAERIRAKFGAYPKDMSVADQTKAAIWEMKTFYGKSYDALTNENLSPAQRMHTVVSDYERPQDVGGSVSNRMGYFNGFKADDTTSGAVTGKDEKKNQESPTVGSTNAAGEKQGASGAPSAGARFESKSGYIVPKDGNLYDSRNAQECATLGKAFNPSIGRSSGWTVVPGQIQAGQVVATMQYNNSGPDRRGAGYHTGVAMTTPDADGRFLLLEQFRGSGGAKLRWVNQNSYPAGKAGGTTSFGHISSGGKVHTEISQEALQYGASLGAPGQQKAMEGAAQGQQAGPVTPAPGDQTAPAGGTMVNPMEGQQSASLMQPMSMMQNVMGMIQGGDVQTASPLGLITMAMGFIAPIIGSIGGVPLQGEGIGDSSRVDPVQQKTNTQYLLHAMNTHGVTDHHKRAAMAAVVKGESNFMPRSESSYATTSNDRIRKIFKTATRGLNDTQLTQLKQNPETFFNHVYSPNSRRGKELGNLEKDDGYKFRGRGFVQLTGRKNYETYGERIGMKDALVRNPDLANDPEIAAKLAVVYMEDRSNKINKGDTYHKVARGVGTAVRDTEKVKTAAFKEYLNSGEFAPHKVASLPDKTSQVAQVSPETIKSNIAPAPTPAPQQQMAMQEPGSSGFGLIGSKSAMASPLHPPADAQGRSIYQYEKEVLRDGIPTGAAPAISPSPTQTSVGAAPASEIQSNASPIGASPASAMGGSQSSSASPANAIHSNASPGAAPAPIPSVTSAQSNKAVQGSVSFAPDNITNIYHNAPSSDTLNNVPASAAPAAPSPGMPNVPGAADGGSFFMPDVAAQAMPFNVAKGDNMMAMNPQTATPMFSYNNTESMTVNPNTNKVNISPNDRPRDVPGPQLSPVMNEMNQVRNEVRAAISMAGQANEMPNKPFGEKQTTSDVVHDTTMKRIAQPFQTPSFYRAMTRTRMQETGDAVNNNHYSYGNAQ